jgi:hypothetical protein
MTLQALGGMLVDMAFVLALGFIILILILLRLIILVLIGLFGLLIFALL